MLANMFFVRMMLCILFVVSSVDLVIALELHAYGIAMFWGVIITLSGWMVTR